MNKKCKIWIGAMLFMTAFSVGASRAQTCIQPPSCDTLGYTMTADQCGDAVKFLKCPLDQSKMFCLTQEEIDGNAVGHVGDILYSDKTFSTELITGKTPIGVVFDEANHLAVSLDQTQLAWANSYEDIPTLGNCSDGLTCSTNGKQNTEAIINYGKANNKGYPAAEYCVAYKPSTVYQDETWYAAGAWFLPSVKELNTLYANKAAVNAALTKVNATTLGNEYYWSSTEYNGTNAWLLRMSDGSRDWYYKSYTSYYVRPVLAF